VIKGLKKDGMNIIRKILDPKTEKYINVLLESKTSLKYGYIGLLYWEEPNIGIELNNLFQLTNY
jgi:hypothetical protein